PAVSSNGTVTLTRSTLAAGASASFTLVVHVGSGVISALANTATGTSSTTDPDPTNNSSTSNTAVTPRADLQVTKTGPATITLGSDATYTITVANTGLSDAQSVSITDPLPAGTTFVSLAQTGGPSFTASTPSAGANG